MKRYSLGNLNSVIKTINKITSYNKNSITIINYHGILDQDLMNFIKQIEFLNKNYSIISPYEFFDFLKGKLIIKKHSILFTFDDGFISSFKAIQNYLNPLNIKVFFFIPSLFIKKLKTEYKNDISNNFFSGKYNNKTLPDEFKPLSINNLNSLIDQGHIIGAHTHTHKDISKLKNDYELNEEIIKPKILYKKKFNIDINSFAFPYGRINNINYELLKKISENYDYCFSNIRGSNNSKTSRYGIKRQNVSPDMPLKYLSFIIEGGLNLYWFLHSQKLKKLANKIIKK